MFKLDRLLVVFVSCSMLCIDGFAQNLDLVEGFYEILDKERDNSRQMLYRGDSALVYYISEQPVVSKHHRKNAEVDTVTNSLYFYFDDQGTEKLLDFTTRHLGGKIGFVYVGSLNKIYSIEEIIDNGVIEFTAENIYKVNRKPPARGK